MDINRNIFKCQELCKVLRLYPTYKLTSNKSVTVSWIPKKGMRPQGQKQRTLLLKVEAAARASQSLASDPHVPQVS